jgi:hypothetical protein
MILIVDVVVKTRLKVYKHQNESFTVISKEQCTFVNKSSCRLWAEVSA